MGTKATRNELGDLGVVYNRLFEFVKDGKRPAALVIAGMQRLADGQFPEYTRFDRYNAVIMYPYRWLDILREYNTKYWGNRFTDEDFARAEAQIDLMPKDHNQNVRNIFGFHVQFDSLEETFWMWNPVYQGELSGASCSTEFNVDSDNLILHELAHSYEPGIHLINIDLASHWEPEDGRTLASVQEPAKGTGEILAQLEVISVYGVLTELFMEQDGKNLPYSDMPGTVVTVPGESEPYALCVYWDHHILQASFDVDWVDNHEGRWAAPVLKKLPQH